MMSVNDNTDKAVSLLREAAILLSGGRESEGNQDTASSTVGRSLTLPETVITNSVSSSNHDQNCVLQNFRSLFAGYRSTNPGTSTCPKRSETKSLPPAKKKPTIWGRILPGSRNVDTGIPMHGEQRCSSSAE